jgi:hypothetical protein
MDKVKIGTATFSRFVLGSNPFSGFSHQGLERDREMVHYFATARIKETLRQAEAAGITTLIARGDHHVMRVLTEYWDEGGTLQWSCQTCPELGPPEPVLRKAQNLGAVACHIHGGYADHLMLNGRIEELRPTVALARELGMTIGVAGHNPATIRWVEENLDVDYYMCCYYNTISRRASAEHRAGTNELYRDEDRQAMVDTIHTLSRPAIHYKVLAAGRRDPAEAFAYVAKNLRPGDAVCVGVYPGDKPDMLTEDVRLFEEALKAHRHGTVRAT